MDLHEEVNDVCHGLLQMTRAMEARQRYSRTETRHPGAGVGCYPVCMVLPVKDLLLAQEC